MQKKEWQRFIVNKITLNPEQAVLSCCSQDSGRPFNERSAFVCQAPARCPGSDGNGMDSNS